MTDSHTRSESPSSHSGSHLEIRTRTLQTEPEAITHILIGKLFNLPHTGKKNLTWVGREIDSNNVMCDRVLSGDSFLGGGGPWSPPQIKPCL